MQHWRQLVVAAAALSLLAGAIHLLVAPAHFEEWWGYGAFFLAVAATQIGFAPLLLARARPAWFAAGIAGNLAIVGLYVITRTVGIPFFGPAAGEVEGVRVIDVVSKGTELALVVILAWLWRSRARLEVLGHRPAGGRPGAPRATGDRGGRGQLAPQVL